jgi:hypothetical protein
MSVPDLPAAPAHATAADSLAQVQVGAGVDPAAPLLEKQLPGTRELVQALRPVVMGAIPGLTEKVHMGWEVIHYAAGPSMRDMVVAIGPHKAYVNLEFGDGVDLPDPARRLEGTGKRMRHVKIRTVEGARHPDVRALLEAAARKRGLLP